VSDDAASRAREVAAWGFVPEDDMFHPPPNDDPWWTETVWFGWMVPERNLLGYFYAVMRANQQIRFGGLLVFDETAVLPWELPVFDYDWHLPMTEPPDLLDTDDLLPGMWLRCVEPGRVFEMGASREDLTLDIRWEAMMAPLLTRQAPPFDHGSHVDQIGHVTGTMVLEGETVPIDCFAMRDRSWGVRRRGRQPKVGYCYATASAQDAFLAISVERKGHDGVTGGFLMRDGMWAPLVSGERRAERDEQGRPAQIAIEAVDEMGRVLHATGVTVSRQVFLAYPSMFCWNSLAHWDFGDGGVTTHAGWGEDQDVWHPRKWREFVRARGRGQ
jgi:hypothetical protein